MSTSIHLISPSHGADPLLLAQRIEDLEKSGAFWVVHHQPSRVLLNHSHMDTCEHRLASLTRALTHPDQPVVMAVRGGYGASDLLPLIPWEELRELSPRLVVGFSDITCLLSALWCKLGWPSIHGPMPGSSLWGQGGREDVEQLLALCSPRQGKKGVLHLRPIGENPGGTQAVAGWLFGGCFSVLTNLIGTPYLPPSLAGAILLFEDTGENSGRLLRCFNQWLQSGMLTGVRGIIFGRLRNLDGAENAEAELKAELARRSQLPCWSSEDFGHVSPNLPFVIGAKGRISPTQQQLQWFL